MSSQKSTFLHALSALSFLSFLLLPPLFFFSFIFILFLFFLLLPIICILLSAFLFSTVVRQAPMISFVKCLLNHGSEASEDPPAMGHVWNDDPTPENSPVSIEFDRSEVPSLEELSEEDEEEMVGFGAGKKRKELWQVQALNSVRCGCNRKFYKILSFWRRIEKRKHQKSL